MEDNKSLETLITSKVDRIKPDLDQVSPDALKPKIASLLPVGLPISESSSSDDVDTVETAPLASSDSNCSFEDVDDDSESQSASSPHRRRNSLFARFHKKSNTPEFRKQMLRRNTVATTHCVSNQATSSLRSCLKKSQSEPRYASERCASSSSVEVQQRRRISFDKIYIREHELTVGDNPSVGDGAPVSLSWKVYDEQELDFESYEEGRSNVRRTHNEFRMPEEIRDELLLKTWGVSYKQVKEAKEQARKIHMQRMNSSYQFQFVDGARILVERASHAYKKKVKKPSQEDEKVRAWTKAYSHNSLPCQ